MSSSQSRNPFVGPRPLSPADPIFGREREIRELLYLLTAERIVLLYSPSGAGKSSLINARNGLLDRMRQRFDVWTPARVNLPPASPVANRFAWSAAVGFEQEVPEDRRRGPEALAHLSLSEAVATRARKHHAPPSTVLVFDQFEEVLRLDPLDIDEKREFFRQLGDLLHDPRIWALFVIREDYLAPLDPYARLLPTHLQNRYRVDLLKQDRAAEAMVRTAAVGGRSFADAAVEKLVYDLSQVKVQQVDGGFLLASGIYIEPMQLQVACRGLWDRMPADDSSIDPEDVDQFGNVTQALSAYYADSVARIAGGNVRTERAIREWAGHKLITPDGIRGQVLRGQQRSEGLSNEYVAGLVSAHLVRGEQRGGALWYELAHDRLISPVQTDNQRWVDEHLSIVQKQAEVWEKSGRPDSMLAAGEDLKAAEVWADENKGSLTDPEEAYLRASRGKRRARRVFRGLMALSVVLAIAAAAGLVWVRRLQQDVKDREEQVKGAERKVAGGEEALRQANAELDKKEKGRQAALQQAKDNAAQAAVRAQEATANAEEARKNLAQLLEEKATPALRDGEYDKAWMYTLAALSENPDLPLSMGRLLLPELRPSTEWAKVNEQAVVEAVNDPDPSTTIRAVTIEPTGGLSWIRVTGSGDSREYFDSAGRPTDWIPAGSLLFASCGGQIFSGYKKHVYSVTARGVRQQPLKDEVVAIACGPDGLLAATREGEIAVLDRELEKTPSYKGTLGPDFKKEAPRSLAVAGNTLAVGDAKGRIALRRWPGLTEVGTIRDGDAGSLEEITFVPRRPGLLLAGTSNGFIDFWDVRAPKAPKKRAALPAHRGSITHMRVIDDGGVLLSAGADGQIRRTPLKALTMGREISLIDLLAGPHPESVVRQMLEASTQVLHQKIDGSLIRPTKDPELIARAKTSYFAVRSPMQVYLFPGGSFKLNPDGFWWWTIRGSMWRRLRAVLDEDKALTLKMNGSSFYVRLSKAKDGWMEVGLPGQWLKLARIADVKEKAIVTHDAHLDRMTDVSWVLYSGGATNKELSISPAGATDDLVFASNGSVVRIVLSPDGSAFGLRNGAVGEVEPLMQAANYDAPPSPRELNHLGRVMTYRNVSLNGKGNVLRVRPGERVQMTFQFATTIQPETSQVEYYCPSCIIQFYVGLSESQKGSSKSFSRCLVSEEIPQNHPSPPSGVVQHSFLAPDEPGLHYITQTWSLEYSCKPNPDGHGHDFDSAIAAIYVSK